MDSLNWKVLLGHRRGRWRLSACSTGGARAVIYRFCSSLGSIPRDRQASMERGLLIRTARFSSKSSSDTTRVMVEEMDRAVFAMLTATRCVTNVRATKKHGNVICVCMGQCTHNIWVAYIRVNIEPYIPHPKLLHSERILHLHLLGGKAPTE